MARLKTAYLAAIFLFLYAPIGVLIAKSAGIAGAGKFIALKFSDAFKEAE